MKIKKGIYNIIFGIISQIVFMAFSFILPRLIMLNYGSEINGLFSSINQVFGYIALLEAGLGAATIQALYKSLSPYNLEDISEILSTTKKYYKKVSVYYSIVVLLLVVSYPLLLTTSIEGLNVSLLIFLQGVSGIISLLFIGTLKQMLIAEGKSYIESNIAIVIHIFTSLGKIFLISISANIVLFQVVYLLATILQALLYRIYFKKYYSKIDLNRKQNKALLIQKNSFLVHQISSLVFSSTDILILSIFCNLKTVSVYAIYNLVFILLNSFFGVINNGVSFILGHTYHDDISKYTKIHDIYETSFVLIVFAVVSATYVLIIPFIEIYTNGISDITYVDKYLPFLFCSIQILSYTRIVCNNLIRISGHMKNTIPNTIIESLINIVVSIVLVQKIGIYGVLIGTIFALLYRTFDIVFYANTRILKRFPSNLVKIVLINLPIYFFAIFINNLYPLRIVSYQEFAFFGSLFTLGFVIIYFVVNMFLNPKMMVMILDMIRTVANRVLTKEAKEKIW